MRHLWLLKGQNYYRHKNKVYWIWLRWQYPIHISNKAFPVIFILFDSFLTYQVAYAILMDANLQHEIILKFLQYTTFTDNWSCKWMFHFLSSIFQFLSFRHWPMIMRNFCHKLQPISIMIIHISWGKSRIWSEQQIRSNSRLQNIAWTLQFLRQLSGRCRKPHIEWHDPIKTQRLRFCGSKLCNVRRLNSQP